MVFLNQKILLFLLPQTIYKIMLSQEKTPKVDLDRIKEILLREEIF